MGQVSRRKNLFVDYILLIFVIFWSGGLVTYGMFAMWPFVMVAVTVLVLLSRNLSITSVNRETVGVFALVLIMQTVWFSGSLTAVVQPILKVLTVAMIAVIVRPHMGHLFIKIMTFTAMASLLFWLIDITPTGHSVLLGIAKQLPQFGGEKLAEMESSWSIFSEYTLYFYNIQDIPSSQGLQSLIRNSGPFFEPGRFTIFLTFSMALILLTRNYHNYKLSFYILFAANISTFSTTGYFAMIMLFTFYFIGRNRILKVSTIIIMLILFTATYDVLQASFMTEKVLVAMENTGIANSRFGAMYYHWTQIKLSPFIGYGQYLGQTFGELEISPCGITDMMRRWGIPVFIYCVLLLYQGTKSYMVDNRLFRLGFTLILLVLSYPQTIMDQPLFYLLYFISSKHYSYGTEV